MQIEKWIVGPLQTNCYLILSKKEMAIVDPGGDGEVLLNKIKSKNQKTKYIINTHYHFDHTSENQKIKKETGGKILIHQAEKDFLNFETDKFLKEGDKIKLGENVLKVIHTPGHTPGSICLLSKGFILTGDTLFYNGFGRTDLRGGSDKQIEKSLKRLERIIKPGTNIYPGHGRTWIKK